MLVIAALLCLIPASELAIAFVQKLASRLVHPEPLPRLELLDGVPEESKTIVVIPTMLTSVEGVGVAARTPRGGGDRQSRSAHSLRDPVATSPMRRRASPWTTRRSWRRREPASRISTRAPAAIPARSSSCFTAIGNGTSASRCGWDGSASAASSKSSTACCAAPTDTSFTTQVGPLDALAGIRYCITLDSDTQLPRDAARELIGIIAHPLNRPVVDPKLRRVTDGYGILQPRVSVTMASAAGSLFARTYAGHTGVDPYTTAVSDVYQDLFGEGIFTGKGLYDIDAFMTALDGPRAGERAALARPVRRPSRARRARHRRRSRRRLSVERADARAPPAPLGARRLADPVVAVPVGADARAASSATGCR